MGFNIEERKRRHERGFYLKRIFIFCGALTVIIFCAAIGEEGEEIFEKTVPYIILGGFIPAVWAFLSIIIGLIPGTSKLEKARKRRVTGRHEVCLTDRKRYDQRPLEVVLAEMKEKTRPKNQAAGRWEPFKWPRRQDTIWWDEVLVDEYVKKFPSFKYSNEYGRIFLDTTWFVDGDKDNPETLELEKEIESRGGFIRTDISGMLTHILKSPTWDEEGIELISAAKYGAEIVTMEDYENLLAIADRTMEHNADLLTPEVVFDSVKAALGDLEEEQGMKYIFMHEYKGGVGFVWYKDGEKKKVLWAGEDAAAFWKEYGEILVKGVIVTARPKDRCFRIIGEKLKEVGIAAPHFVYIDTVFFWHSRLRHQEREVLGDIKAVSRLFGQVEPEEENTPEAVGSLFMAPIIDLDKNPEEFTGYCAAL